MNIPSFSPRQKKLGACGAALLVALVVGYYEGLRGHPVFHNGRYEYYDTLDLPSAALATGFSFLLLLWSGYSLLRIASFLRGYCRRETLARLKSPRALGVMAAAVSATGYLMTQHRAGDVVGGYITALIVGLGAVIAVTPLLSLALFLRHGFSRKTAGIAKKPVLLVVSLLGTIAFLLFFDAVLPGRSQAFEMY